MVGFLSCTNEPKPNEPQITSLHGKWELKEAFTNNKPTQRLDGAFLQFNEDGTMVTNILGMPEIGSYEMNKSTIVQNTGREVKYKIEKLEANELSVVMNLASKKFQIKLAKVE